MNSIFFENKTIKKSMELDELDEHFDEGINEIMSGEFNGESDYDDEQNNYQDQVSFSIRLLLFLGCRKYAQINLRFNFITL